jgi:SRSO17 transposase
MDGDGADRFGAFVNALAEVVGHADRVRPLRDYCMGLLTRRSARASSRSRR